VGAGWVCVCVKPIHSTAAAVKNLGRNVKEAAWDGMINVHALTRAIRLGTLCNIFEN